MNSAAAELCLENVGLLDKRGELRQLAWKKVKEGEMLVQERAFTIEDIWQPPHQKVHQSGQNTTKI